MANIFKGVTVDHAEAHNEQISVGVGQPWIAKTQKVMGYFSLRAQIFKLFLASCVPYVNFHCLQEKVWFIFVEVSPENWDTILTDSVTNMEQLARKQYLITHSFFRVRKHHICWVSVKYCRIVACWEGFLGETNSYI